MLNGKHFCGVMDRAIAIVVIADGAVKKVITEDAIKCLHLGSRGLFRFCGDCHSIGNSDRTCSLSARGGVFRDAISEALQDVAPA